MKDYTVCGVIDSNIFYLHGKKNYSQIYISDKDTLNNLSSANKKLCIYSRDFLEAVNPLSVVLSSVIATILFLIITFFETFTVSKLITKEKVNH